MAPTITIESGLIVGTAAYMSPEQARGQAVDKRSDIWAFGCVLYELVTGKMAFGGATVPDTLSAVLHQEPDWTALPQAPPAVTTLLRRCLEKDVRQRRRDIGDVRAELQDALATSLVPDGGRPRPRRLLPLVAGAATIIAAAALGAWAIGWWSTPVPSEPRVRQITDLVGIEEMPAVSPDGKDVAFVAPVDGRRQIWLRRLGGGLAHQITRDDIDHDYPRWTPDSNAILYLTPAEKEGEPGTLWEIPALGGTARRLAQVITGADVSHDGQRVAMLQKAAGGVVLAIASRDGIQVKTIPVVTALEYFTPRWSPDDRSIAFIINEGNLMNVIYVTDLASGLTHEIVRTRNMKGLTWLPDGSGLVYSSAAGSTLRYPPGFNLRTVSRDGRNDRQLTIGDVSYVDPDMVQAGKIFASGIRMQSDIWRFSTTGSPAENVRNSTQLTHQTAQVQTPSASPDDKQIAYLSNSGGQGNVWVANTDGSGTPRPLTTESHPAVTVGLPLWSPTSNWILYIKTRPPGQNSQWLIRSDGSDNHQLTASGTGAAWSPDGRWVYFSIFTATTSSCIYKVSVEGGEPVRIRCEASSPVPSSDGTTLYFGPGRPSQGNEIFKANPPDGDAVRLQAYAASRIPWFPNGYTLSPNERWLAVTLKDGATTNIWVVPTDGSPMRKITDFGRRATMIARAVSWSRDSRSIYAAVAEMDADIVLLESVGFTPH
jgi:Tol biopolymer transport system component